MAYNESVSQKLNALNVIPVFHNDLLQSNTLLIEFQDVFFVRGTMIPNDNEDFVKLTIERLLSVHAYMKTTETSNVFHIENDNMIYIDLYKLCERAITCGVKFGYPRATANHAIMSFIYIQNISALEHFARWCVNLFRLGPDKASKLLNFPWINDMTIGSSYLHLHASNKEMGVFELPTRFYATSENCCLCDLTNDNKKPIIFDSCVLGQYFGGAFSRPNVSYWEENRLFDPRGDIIIWVKDHNDHIRRPFIRGVQIINIHVHSKHLDQFLSYNNTFSVMVGNA